MATWTGMRHKLENDDLASALLRRIRYAQCIVSNV